MINTSLIEEDNNTSLKEARRILNTISEQTSEDVFEEFPDLVAKFDQKNQVSVASMLSKLCVSRYGKRCSVLQRLVLNTMEKSCKGKIRLVLLLYSRGVFDIPCDLVWEIIDFIPFFGWFFMDDLLLKMKNGASMSAAAALLSKISIHVGVSPDHLFRALTYISQCSPFTSHHVCLLLDTLNNSKKYLQEEGFDLMPIVTAMSTYARSSSNPFIIDAVRDLEDQLSPSVPE
eukprot:TRINITY_DN14267_c0_g1_i1.p1 TRINITY_DN14267_c0_g1~~TRINITY_DN14267_c0_g1_i1.p1  ORF type:complete len:254 (+),score=22.79 TRINITY_DN14267_c0_g1_i1:70-762(+)